METTILKKPLFELDEGYLGDSEESLNEAYGEVEVDNLNSLLDTKINVNPGSLQIDSILSSLEAGYYFIPPFQRRYVWTKDKVAYLALSIIKNIPIPPMYVYISKKDKKHVVLDGQQRMISIFLYFNDLTYVGSDNHIDFRKVAELSRCLHDIEAEITSMKLDKAKKLLIKEKEKKQSDIKKTLLNEHGMKTCKYTVKVEDGDELDISFSEFDINSRNYIIRKTLGITVVDCNNDSPQKTYANIFKLLNSAGKSLGEQEIRNGIYWETNLYKRLYTLNLENEKWRKIYGSISIYSKDIEILLKALSLKHYILIDDERLIINFPGFSWIKIMATYSELSLEEDFNEEINDLVEFLDKIVGIESSEKKCRKAVFEAVFIATGLYGKEKINTIEYEWICDMGDKFGNIESSKSSVEERLNIALMEVKEQYR